MIREGYFAGAGNELPGPFTALLGQNQWLGARSPLTAAAPGLASQALSGRHSKTAIRQPLSVQELWRVPG